MNEPLTFLLIFFAVVFAAKPLARIIRVPVLSLYLIAGIIIGPSGFSVLKSPLSQQYFYDLGIILLMFSAGLELKLRVFRENRKDLLTMYLLNAILPGFGGFLVGFALNRFFHVTDDLFFPLFIGSVFTSCSIEIIIPLFREFAGRTNRRVRNFSSMLVSSIIMAEITSLFFFSGIVTYHSVNNIGDLAAFVLFAALFFLLVFKGLPILQQKAARRFEKIRMGDEEQTRILIMLLVIVVAVGALLHIHPIVCAFLVGISLANVHISRRALHNIDFITFSIFVPVFFIAIGAEMDIGIFWQERNYLYPLILTGAMFMLRAGGTFIGALLARFDFRRCLGFGFANIPQLTGTLATAVVAKKIGILPDTLFNSIVILSIVTTFASPMLTKALLFPRMRRKEGDFSSSDDLIHTDIRPIPFLTPFSGVVAMMRDTELPVYPVVNENDVYLGVLHLDDVKNLVFAEDLDNLVIATDFLDREYPSVCREMPLEETIAIFKQPGIHALPVTEECGEHKVYVGMLLLRDILPGQI